MAYPTDNLGPNRNKRTNNLGEYAANPEKAAEAQRKSAQSKSVNAKRRRTMREVAQEVLAMQVKEPEMIKKMSVAFTPDGEPITVDQAIAIAQASKAIFEGDTKAAEFVRDTAGDKPADKQEVTNVSVEQYLDKLDDGNGGGYEY